MSDSGHTNSGQEIADRLAAYHEAAHALVAIFGEVIDLAGPVSIDTRGGGAADLRQNNAQILAVLGEDFEPDEVHERFVAAYLAGPLAERLLVQQEGLDVSEAETEHAGRFDKAMAEERLNRMDKPKALGSYLNATHNLLAGWVWRGVSEFAEELLVERSLPAERATFLAQECLDRHRPPD